MKKININGNELNLVENIETYELLESLLPFSSDIHHFRVQKQYLFEKIGTIYSIDKAITSDRWLFANYFVPDSIKKLTK